MGASDFTAIGTGASQRDAFLAAVTEAQYEYGHRGYTGTIAEKHEVVTICATPTADDAARDLAQRLMDADDPRIDDKWGPCGAIRLRDVAGAQRWLFFGWASS